MNIKISNETYLKYKDEVSKFYPNMSEEQIQEYLIDYMADKVAINHFGNFVCMKEVTQREKNI
jgi:ACT domain-containing protein